MVQLENLIWKYDFKSQSHRLRVFTFQNVQRSFCQFILIGIDESVLNFLLTSFTHFPKVTVTQNKWLTLCSSQLSSSLPAVHHKNIPTQLDWDTNKQIKRQTPKHNPRFCSDSSAERRKKSSSLIFLVCYPIIISQKITEVKVVFSSYRLKVIWKLNPSSQSFNSNQKPKLLLNLKIIIPILPNLTFVQNISVRLKVGLTNPLLFRPSSPALGCTRQREIIKGDIVFHLVPFQLLLVQRRQRSCQILRRDCGWVWRYEHRISKLSFQKQMSNTGICRWLIIFFGRTDYLWKNVSSVQSDLSLFFISSDSHWDAAAGAAPPTALTPRLHQQLICQSVSDLLLLQPLPAGRRHSHSAGNDPHSAHTKLMLKYGVI